MMKRKRREQRELKVAALDENEKLMHFFSHLLGTYSIPFNCFTIIVFHIGYFRHTITLLQCICKYCSRIKISEEARLYFLRQMRSLPDVLQKKEFYKEVVDKAKKGKICTYCGQLNGIVKKIAALKIVHER